MRLKAEKAIANGSIMHTKMIWMGQGLEIKGMDCLRVLRPSCLCSGGEGEKCTQRRRRRRRRKEGRKEGRKERKKKLGLK